MNSKHQWAVFQKGRMRIKACACCGDLHLPSNTEKVCENRNIFESQIVKAGYKIFSHQQTA
jgi:hypothetical protein